MLFRSTAIASALAVLSACGEKSAAPAVNATHAAITDSLTGPSVRDGVWSGADAHASWHAILAGPRITQLDEIALFTDSTRAMRQFTFDSTGVLSGLREERTQLVYGAKAKPDTVNTVIELEWSHDSLTRSLKRVNGKDKMLQPYEIDNLRTHINEVVRIARTGSTRDTPPR